MKNLAKRQLIEEQVNFDGNYYIFTDSQEGTYWSMPEETKEAFITRLTEDKFVVVKQPKIIDVKPLKGSIYSITYSDYLTRYQIRKNGIVIGSHDSKIFAEDVAIEMLSMEPVVLKQNEYVGTDVLKKLKSEDLAKRWFIIRTRVNSYAEGITGTNLYLGLYANKGAGWRVKKDFREYLKTIKANSKNKITQEDRGYGALGDWYRVVVLRGSDAAEFIKNHDRYSSSIVIKK